MRKKSNPYLLKKNVGRGTTDTRKAPDWWLSRADEAESYLRSLKGVEVREIGKSAGGRSIICASLGPRETLPGRTSVSLASGLESGDVQTFYGQGTRERESFLFIGNAHGLEYEGTVAMLNALNAIITGKDLRGKSWPRLREAGRKMRLVIIPHLNMDGRMRFAEHKHKINIAHEEQRRIFFGNWKGGEPIEWRPSHGICPIPADKLETPMGVYFNDAGMNLFYDTGFGADIQPETGALLRLLREELPDCALLSHTNGGSLASEPSPFIPKRFRNRQAQIAALVGAACKTKGLCRFAIAREALGHETFTQIDLVHHVTGGLPLLVEFPSGYNNEPDNHDEILDIGMTALEEILWFGASYGFSSGIKSWQ